MPLHCAAARPKFLNVQYLSFSNPADCLDEISENQKHVSIFNVFFVFFRPLYLALWCRLVIDMAQNTVISSLGGEQMGEFYVHVAPALLHFWRCQSGQRFHEHLHMGGRGG